MKLIKDLLRQWGKNYEKKIKKVVEEVSIVCDICQNKMEEDLQCDLCGKDICRNCSRSFYFSPDIFANTLIMHVCKDCFEANLLSIYQLWKEKNK